MGSQNIKCFHYCHEIHLNFVGFTTDDHYINFDFRFGDQPTAVGGPHLDYHQNKTLRLEYHNRVGPPMPEWIGNLTEGSVLMGEWDTDDMKLGNFQPF